MKIESIRLKNFKAFKEALISDIPKLCVVVGANGTGKTTFFEVFDFLKEAYKDNPGLGTVAISIKYMNSLIPNHDGYSIVQRITGINGLVRWVFQLSGCGQRIVCEELSHSKSLWFLNQTWKYHHTNPFIPVIRCTIECM